MLLSSARILCSYSVHLGCILCYAEANIHGCTQCKLNPCFKHDAHRLKAIMHAVTPAKFVHDRLERLITRLWTLYLKPELNSINNSCIHYNCCSYPERLTGGGGVSTTAAAAIFEGKGDWFLLFLENNYYERYWCYHLVSDSSYKGMPFEPVTSPSSIKGSAC